MPYYDPNTPWGVDAQGGGIPEVLTDLASGKTYAQLAEEERAAKARPAAIDQTMPDFSDVNMPDFSDVAGGSSRRAAIETGSKSPAATPHGPADSEFFSPDTFVGRRRDSVEAMPVQTQPKPGDTSHIRWSNAQPGDRASKRAIDYQEFTPSPDAAIDRSDYSKASTWEGSLPDHSDRRVANPMAFEAFRELPEIAKRHADIAQEEAIAQNPRLPQQNAIDLENVKTLGRIAQAQAPFRDINQLIDQKYADQESQILAATHTSSGKPISEQDRQAALSALARMKAVERLKYHELSLTKKDDPLAALIAGGGAVAAPAAR